MHLKLVLALAFVAVVSARPDAYVVKVLDNQIVVNSENGRYVKFITQYVPQNYNQQFYGQQFDNQYFIQVYVNGPDVPQTTYNYLDNQVAVAGVSQSDILYQIFNKFVGVLNEQQFNELLTFVAKYVENGEINPSVLYALQYVFYGEQSYLKFNQGFYQGEQYNTGLGYLLGKEGYNKYFGNYYGGYQKQYPYGKYFGNYYGNYQQQYPFNKYFGNYYGYQGQYQQQYPYSKYFGNYYGNYQGQYPYFYQNKGYEYNRPSVYQYEGYYGPYSGNYQGFYGQGYGQQYQYGLGYANQYRYPSQFQGLNQWFKNTGIQGQYNLPYYNQYSNLYY